MDEPVTITLKCFRFEPHHDMTEKNLFLLLRLEERPLEMTHDIFTLLLKLVHNRKSRENKTIFLFRERERERVRCLGVAWEDDLNKKRKLFIVK